MYTLTELTSSEVHGARRRACDAASAVSPGVADEAR